MPLYMYVPIAINFSTERDNIQLLNSRVQGSLQLHVERK